MSPSTSHVARSAAPRDADLQIRDSESASSQDAAAKHPQSHLRIPIPLLHSASVLLFVAALIALAAGGFTHPSPARGLQTFAVALALVPFLLGYSSGRLRFSAETLNPDAAPGSLASRLPLILLVTALVIGAVLRFSGIDFGLPHPYHPDELRKSNVIRGMLGRHSLDPQYFLHPSLLLYLAEGLTKLFKAAEQVGIRLIPDGDLNGLIILAGRSVSCLAGIITIGAVYLLGTNILLDRRSARPTWDGKLLGALGAAILAVSPLHITCSRYFKEDALLTLFITLSAFLVVRAVGTGRMTLLSWAGLAAGFACGTKYSGLLTVVPILGIALADRRAGLRQLFMALALVVIGFVICTPYAILTPDAFLAGVASESVHARSGHHGAAIESWTQLWCFHFWGSILPGAGITPSLLALFGAGYALRSFFAGRGAGIVWPLTVMCGLMWYVSAEAIPSKPFPQPDRYVLPVLPFLSILAGGALLFAAAAIRSTSKVRPVAIITLLLVFAAAGPAAHSILLARSITPDTRLEMRRYIDAQIPKKTKILTMGGTVYLPRFAPGSYRVGSARSELGTDKEGIVEKLKASGYQYLLTSSFDTDLRYFEQDSPGEKRRKLAYEEIEHGLRIVHRTEAPGVSYGFHNPTVTLYSLD